MEKISIVYWVQDATLSVKFYKKLGFEVIESTDRHAIVKAVGLEVILVTMRDEEEFNVDSLASTKGKGMYLYVKVADVDKKCQELTNLGIEISTQPRDWDWGNREFIVKDPDGYKICFWNKI